MTSPLSHPDKPTGAEPMSDAELAAFTGFLCDGTDGCPTVPGEKTHRASYHRLLATIAADRQQIADLRAQVEGMIGQLAQKARFEWNDEQMRLLQERNDRMRDALAPFAALYKKMGERYMRAVGHTKQRDTMPAHWPGPETTVGDLRKAAAVMGEQK